MIISCGKKTETTAPETPQTDVMKKYPISLAQWSVHIPYERGLADPMDFAQYAAELGFEGIEYVNQLYEDFYLENPEEKVPELAKMLKERADAAGVQPVLIMTDHLGELTDLDETARQKAVEQHKLWVDACHMLGCKAMRVNAFGLADSDETKAALAQSLITSMKELGAYGKSKDVKILIENHGEVSSDPDWVAEVLQATDHPYAGTLPDFGNWCIQWSAGERWKRPCVYEYPDPYEGIAKMMPYAGGVSAKAYAFDENGEETTYDYAKMAKVVRDSGFEGYIGVEYENDDDLDPREGILKTKQLIEKHFN